jgi:glycosyltransferase involved in cell wall biosynthesis
MHDLELTILMPCLNEAETLKACIGAAQTFLNANNISGEILVADNGSTDGSQDLARAAGARVVTATERGYGAVLKYGIEAAAGRYVIMGDADGSYDFLNLMPFLTALHSGVDLVVGNRFLGGIQKGAMPLLNRYLGNPVLSFIARIFFRSHIRDFHCGLRGFNRASVLSLDLQTSGMEFASEMIVKAILQKLIITEAPTTLAPDGRSRPPHLKPWRDGWRHLKLLFLLRCGLC